MPIGIGAAMLIGSAVAGGTAVAASKIQSNAASNAQKAQQTATNQALAVQQQQSAPYRALGQQGVDRLTAMGAPQPYTQQFHAPGGGPQSNGYQAFQPGGAPPQGPPGGGGLAGIGQPPSQGPQGQPAPQMVTLQAPDGSTRQFPAIQAQQVMQQAQSAGHALRMVN